MFYRIFQLVILWPFNPVNVLYAKASNPCEGIKYDIQATEKKKLEPIIAKHLKKELVDMKVARMMNSFRFDGWQIYRIDTSVSDDIYVFYSGNPEKHSYVYSWGGVGTVSEGPEIEEWINGKAKNIPPKLNKCFSWFVTVGK